MWIVSVTRSDYSQVMFLLRSYEKRLRFDNYYLYDYVTITITKMYSGAKKSLASPSKLLVMTLDVIF